jgi:hypothetical protein
MQTSADDDVFRALADRQRRSVVRYLVTDDDGVASYGEVAEYVAAHHATQPAEVMTALRHTILPMLAEMDLVRYDHEAERIRYLGNRVVEDVLAVVETE